MGAVFKKNIPNRNVVGHIELLEGINQVLEGLNSIVRFEKNIKGKIYQVNLSRLSLEERKKFGRNIYYPWSFSATPGVEEDLAELCSVLERLKLRLSSITKKEIDNSINLSNIDIDSYKKNMIPVEEDINFMFFQMSDGLIVNNSNNKEK